MASQEVLDEIAAHPGVTQPGQQHPDPSPVEELLGYVRDTWTGPSKISFISANKILNLLNKHKINNVFFQIPGLTRGCTAFLGEPWTTGRTILWRPGIQGRVSDPDHYPDPHGSALI
jgi:hypothetical protein